MLGAVRQYAGAWMGRGGPLVVPWKDVPKSSINTWSTALAGLSPSPGRLPDSPVGKALDGTFNDAVLAMRRRAAHLSP